MTRLRPRRLLPLCTLLLLLLVASLDGGRVHAERLRKHRSRQHTIAATEAAALQPDAHPSIQGAAVDVAQRQPPAAASRTPAAADAAAADVALFIEVDTDPSALTRRAEQAARDAAHLEAIRAAGGIVLRRHTLPSSHAHSTIDPVLDAQESMLLEIQASVQAQAQSRQGAYARANDTKDDGNAAGGEAPADPTHMLALALYNMRNTQYMGAIGIGTPPQDFDVIFVSGQACTEKRATLLFLASLE